MNKKTTLSNIRSILYQGEKKMLEIRFYSGGTYLYTGVPNDVYRKLEETQEKDEYLVRNIKTKYRCSKLLTV